MTFQDRRVLWGRSLATKTAQIQLEKVEDGINIVKKRKLIFAIVILYAIVAGLLIGCQTTLHLPQALSTPSPTPFISDETALVESPLPELNTLSTPDITPSTEEGNQGDSVVDYEFAVTEDGNVTITKYTGSGGDVVIPAELDGRQVSAIGNTFGESGAFQDCITVSSIVIPNGITAIQDNAFQGCTALTTVTIPASVTLLQNCAFDNCPNLQSVYFDGDAPKTGNYVFNALNLIFYYHNGADGWTNPWYGRATTTYEW